MRQELSAPVLADLKEWMQAERATVASQREIAIAWWGPAEVAKQWDESYWMRARVRYRLAAACGIERERGAGGEAQRDGD